LKLQSAQYLSSFSKPRGYKYFEVSLCPITYNVACLNQQGVSLEQKDCFLFQTHFFASMFCDHYGVWQLLASLQAKKEFPSTEKKFIYFFAEKV